MIDIVVDFCFVRIKITKVIINIPVNIETPELA